MALKFKSQCSGPRFNVVALELDNGQCPAVEYLQQLESNNVQAHKRLLAVLDRHANHGPILNIKISRELKGDRYKHIYEFKTPQGARLFYFYMPGKVTVLTNGCNKGDPAKPSYEKARAFKLQLEKEMRRGKQRRKRGQLR